MKTIEEFLSENKDKYPDEFLNCVKGCDFVKIMGAKLDDKFITPFDSFENFEFISSLCYHYRPRMIEFTKQGYLTLVKFIESTSLLFDIDTDTEKLSRKSSFFGSEVVISSDLKDGFCRVTMK